MQSETRDRPPIFCLDLEGVLIPEIWEAIARRYSLPELEQTTRDSGNYDELMAFRLRVLRREDIRWPDIRAVIEGLESLPGAEDFLADIRSVGPVVVLTDSFDLFVRVIRPSLGLDCILCHSLLVDETGRITGWRERTPDSKFAAIGAFRDLGYAPCAIGDSLNDIAMLGAAERGILFNPSPAAIKESGGRFTVAENHVELARLVLGTRHMGQAARHPRNEVHECGTDAPSGERTRRPNE